MDRSRRNALKIAMASAVATATMTSLLDAAAAASSTSTKKSAAAKSPKLGKVGRNQVNLKLKNGNILQLTKVGKDWQGVQLDSKGQKLRQKPVGDIRLPGGGRMTFDKKGNLAGGKGAVADFALDFSLITD